MVFSLVMFRPFSVIFSTPFFSVYLIFLFSILIWGREVGIVSIFNLPLFSSISMLFILDNCINSWVSDGVIMVSFSGRK